MHSRLFVLPERLAQLVMAMASHQLAEEELEQAQETAQDCAGAVVDIHREMQQDDIDYIGKAAMLLMEIVGVDRKMQCIRLLQNLFDIPVREASSIISKTDAILRLENPMLYAKEKVKDVEAASARLEAAQLAVVRLVGENRELIDGALRQHSDEQHVDEEDDGGETADELNNLMLEWDAATQAMLEVIARPAR